MSSSFILSFASFILSHVLLLLEQFFSPHSPFPDSDQQHSQGMLHQAVTVLRTGSSVPCCWVGVTSAEAKWSRCTKQYGVVAGWGRRAARALPARWVEVQLCEGLLTGVTGGKG